MKRTTMFLFVLLIAFTKTFAQQLYDNGPVIIGANDRYLVNEYKWNYTDLTYYIYNSSTHLTASERESAIQAAFAKLD